MSGVIDKIFIAPDGGAGMEAVAEAEAIAGQGLRGDRYCQRSGYWIGKDECQITLIRAEDLEQITASTGIQIQNGEHRRNLVTRGLPLDSLAGKRFQAGSAILEYDRPRPPCGYIQSLTEPGMMKALLGSGGICARVIQSGTIRVADSIEVLS